MCHFLQPIPCSGLHPVQTFWVSYRLKSWVQLLYIVTTYRDCNEKRGLVACFGFRKNVSAASSLVSGCTGSLHVLPFPCTWYYPIPAHGITLSLHMILPCSCTWYYPVPAHDITLSLDILPCPCAWFYPVPAHITLSLSLVVPCFCAWLFRVWKYMKFKSWWPCLSLVISFRGQETSHLLDGRETNCSDRWNNFGYLTEHNSSSEG